MVAALAVAVVTLACLCLVVGAVDIPARAVFDILAGHGCGNQAWELIITQSRLPLVATAALAGAAIALLCQLVSVLPTSVGIIPINAITPIVGVPIIIYIILNREKIKYFN